jgi:hypothetical protein
MSLFSWLGSARNARRFPSNGRRPKRRARPQLEVTALEDRTVPTVIFKPVFGNENVDIKSGPRVQNGVVYLMFWGSYWNNNPAQETAIINDVKGMLFSPYLSGLTQYGGTAGDAIWGNAINNPSDPPSNVGYFDLRGALLPYIANASFPRPSTVHKNDGSNFDPIYLAVTPPNVTASVTGGPDNGFHTATVQLFGDTGLETEYIGVASSNNSNANNNSTGNRVVDNAVSTLSHEIVEAMSDPEGGEVKMPDPFANLISPAAAVLVNPGIKWTADGAHELGDYEPDDRRYNYRVNGALVQAYWSQNTVWAGQKGYFVVQDGMTDTMELDPDWSQSTIRFNLVITTDQLGSRDNTLTVARTVTGGVQVNLDGQPFYFEPNSIDNITINDGAGDDTVTLVSDSVNVNISSVPDAKVTINGGPAGSTVHLTSSFAPVTINPNGGNFYVPPSTFPNITFNGPSSQLHQVIVLTDISTVTNTVTIRPDPAKPANMQVIEDGTTLYDVPAASLESIEVDEGGANDTVNIDASPSFAATVPILIRGGTGTDHTNLGSSLNDFAAVPMSVTVLAGSNINYLNVNDVGDPTAHTWTIAQHSITTDGPFAGIVHFNGGIQHVDIAGGTASNTYIVQNTEAGDSTTLETQRGSDQIDVGATSGPLAISSGYGSTPTVRVGSTLDAGGTLQYISGPINISNPSGKTDLALEDGSDTGDGQGHGRTVAVTPTSVTGMSPAPITFSSALGGGVTELDLRGGNFNNTFDIQGTGAGEALDVRSGGGNNNHVYVESISGPLSVDDLAGTDTVDLGENPAGGIASLVGINGPVSVANSSGTTNLNVDDQADTAGRTATVTNGQILGLSPDPISYFGSNVPVNIHGGGGDNIYDVLSTPQQTLTLSTGADNDQVNVVSTTGTLKLQCMGKNTTTVTVGSLTAGSGGSLANINGPIAISTVSTTGTIRLNVDDSGDTTAQNFTLTDGSVAGNNPAPIIYTPQGIFGAGVSELHVYGGSGGNTFNVNNTSALVNTYISTGTGDDFVNVRATKGPLFVTNPGGNDTDVEGSLAPMTGGTLANILGPVNFDENGTTAVLLDDSGGTTSRNYTFNQGVVTISGIAGTTSAAAGDTITVLANNLPTNFLVQSTLAGAPLTLTAGTGATSFQVGDATNSLDNLLSPVTLIGNGTSSPLIVNDTAATTAQADDIYTDHLDHGLSGGALGNPIYYSDLTGITFYAGTGGDTGNGIAVHGSAASAPVAVFGQAGVAQTEFVASTIGTSGPAPFLSPVMFHGAGSPDFAVYLDNGSSTSTYTLTMDPALATRQLVQQTGQSMVSFDGVVEVIVYTSPAGGNAVNVRGVAQGVEANLGTETGDVVTVGSIAPQLGGTLGDIRGAVLFSGGTHTGTMIVDDSADTQGRAASIDPPPPNDPFSPWSGLSGLTPNSTFTESINWWLGDGSQVTLLGGSGGNSFVIHGSIPNVALTIYAGTGNNLLIAGLTAANLVGGPDPNNPFDNTIPAGNNILIGGTTDYDYNADAISAIMAELSQATDATFDSVVSDLASGANGLPALNASTVHANGLANQLTGGANRNWFFASSIDQALDFTDGDVFTTIS